MNDEYAVYKEMLPRPAINLQELAKYILLRPRAKLAL
jgi:hypothetical protein